MKETREKKLWEQFSIFIRNRDADENGYVKCFTCPTIKHWKEGDCGHGIARQHKATKYDEKNNHFQCKHCNWAEGGKREVYKIEMDKKYGEGTWDLMEFKSKQKCNRSKFEIDALEKYYKDLNNKL